MGLRVTIYTSWTWHGEFYDQGMSSTSLCDDLHVDHIKVEVEGEDDNDENDRVDDMLHSLEEEGTDRPHMYDSILSAPDKPMYPGCKNFTKPFGILTLFNMKSKHSWTDKILSELFTFYKNC